MTRRVLLALALVALVTCGASSSAQAQEGSALFIREVDATKANDVKVDFVWNGSAGDVSGMKFTLNGSEVSPTAPPAQIKTDIGVALVIDTGPQMDTDGFLVNAREGAKKMVQANPGVQFAIIQAGDKPLLRHDFTSNTSTLVATIEGLGNTKGSAVWSALNIAGAALKAQPALQPNVMLIVGDNDNVKNTDEPLGRSSVTTSGASVWAIERAGSMDPSGYDNLVSTAGGQVLVADSPQKMSDLIVSAGNTISTQQYGFAYDSKLGSDGTLDMALTVGGQTATANVLVGGTYQGAQELHPNVIKPSGGIPGLDNVMVFAVALALTLVAAVGIAYALTSLLIKDDLSSMLQPYADGYGGGGELEDSDNTIVKSALIQRAVSLTEQVADNQGLLTRAEGALERANLPLRAGEALFFYLTIVIVLTLLGLLFYRNLVTGLVFGAVGALLPVMVVNSIAKRRRKKFMGQLPDTLQLLSGTLRAGYSLMQGVEAVSQEVDEPMGLELRRVITESRLGRPLEESLEASADRMDSADFAWAVMAIGIQREVGGNLAELLLTVADTMVHRERLRRDVAALTAEGRISAYVLAGLPPGLGLIMYVLNPEYVTVLFTDPMGIGMLITAGISMLIGFFWMKKIITIEI